MEKLGVSIMEKEKGQPWPDADPARARTTETFELWPSFTRCGCIVTNYAGVRKRKLLWLFHFLSLYLFRTDPARERQQLTWPCSAKEPQQGHSDPLVSPVKANHPTRFWHAKCSSVIFFPTCGQNRSVWRLIWPDSGQLSHFKIWRSTSEQFRTG